ncbi:MAG: hypothetical protein QUS11_00085 [Candidatus Fermentibacter sp.]|nr:hypothetical protein [Candidatus Fermentibacter sp.]
MKRLSLILLVLSAAAWSAALEQFVSLSVESDSLGFSPGRRQALWNGMISEGSWGVRVTDRYLDADSGGLVPRRFLGRNDLLVDGDARFGALTVSPGFRWNTAAGDGLDFILPDQQGTVLDRSYTRPELGLGVSLPHGFGAFVEGSLVERSLEYPDGSSLGWSGQGAEGYVEWDAPGLFWARAGGSFRKHSSDDIGFDTDWSGVGAAVGIRTTVLPARVQLVGQAEYGTLSGEDYLGGDLGERASLRLRAVRSFTPGMALDMTVFSSLDHRDGAWYRAASSGAARLVLTRGRPGEIPSQLVLGGQVTSSSFTTARFEASGRLHLVEGLSTLLSATARRIPTTVAGAGPERDWVTLGAGLEYRFSTLAVVWAKVQQERTILVDTEDWTRLDAGIQFWPPSISI